MESETITLPGGAKMPVLGFGTCQFGNTEKLVTPLEVAFKSGYRHFDTAFTYHSEEILGKCIAGWIEDGFVERKDLFITTKLPIFGAQPERVDIYLNKSLKKLGLDYVDLYLIHFPVCCKYEEGKEDFVVEEDVFLTETSDYVAIWKKMEEMVDAGKAKHIGLSNFNSDQISNILDRARIKPANLQIEIHPYLQNKELVKFCKEKGISVVACAPLGSPSLYIFLNEKGIPARKFPNIMEDPIVVFIAKKHWRTPAQIILRYTIQRGISAIPQSMTRSHIKENIDIFDFSLDEKDMAALANLDKGNEGRVCGMEFKGIKDHPEYPFNKN